ncbi:MAG: Crp/Fnr family transcriptional regulator [Parasphingorhabdus sp.]
MNFQDFVSKHGVHLTKNVGEHLFRQGDEDRSLYIVRSGLLKAYYLSGDGKENIKSFILPGSNIGSLVAIYAKQQCTFSLICLQDSELIKLDFDAIYQASKENLEIASPMIDFLLAFAMKKERREYELLCLSAEERYRLLLENMPNIADRVTQNELALYLGITPVGLSRIRKRVHGQALQKR